MPFSDYFSFLNVVNVFKTPNIITYPKDQKKNIRKKNRDTSDPVDLKEDCLIKWKSKTKFSGNERNLFGFNIILQIRIRSSIKNYISPIDPLAMINMYKRVKRSLF